MLYTVILHGLYGRILEEHRNLTKEEATSLRGTLNSYNFDGNSWVETKEQTDEKEVAPIANATN